MTVVVNSNSNSENSSNSNNNDNNHNKKRTIVFNESVKLIDVSRRLSTFRLLILLLLPIIDYSIMPCTQYPYNKAESSRVYRSPLNVNFAFNVNELLRNSKSQEHGRRKDAGHSIAMKNEQHRSHLE